MRHLFMSGSLLVAAAAYAACVGDDPGAPSAPEDAGTETSTEALPDSAVDAAAEDADAGANDSKNCGAPGHDCLGGECTDGVCQPVELASGQNRPGLLLVEAGWVYWINLGTLKSDGSGCDPTKKDGAIMRVKVDGSNLGAVAAGLECPGIFALGNDAVYFTIPGSGADGAIYKVPKDGSAPPAVVHGSLPPPKSVVADDTHLYWGYDVSGGQIWRSPLAGGNPELFAAGQTTPRGFRPHNTDLYWTTSFGQSTSVGNLRGASRAGPIPDGGVDASVLVGALKNVGATPHPRGNFVYYTYGGNGSPWFVGAHKLSDGTTSMLSPDGINLPRGLASDGDYLYIASPYNCVQRVPLGGGKVERFVSLEACIGIDVDSTAVYLTAQDTGKVRRIVKPVQ